MTKQVINVGASANDKQGDSLRAAFQKVNTNFTELYLALGLDSGGLNLGAFEFTGSTITTTDSSSIVIDQATTISSDLTVGGDLIPQIANGGDLGSLVRPWKSLYVSNSTVYLGGVPLSLEVGTNELKINNVPISQNITYTDIPNAPTDLADLTDTSGLLEMSTLVNGAYTVSLGSDGLLNVAGPVTLPNYGELRPSSAAYDAALQAWENFRARESEYAQSRGFTAQGWPFIEWHVNGGNVAEYLAELNRIFVIQNTPGATLVWTPAISSAFRAEMRVLMQIIQSAYTGVGSGVSVSSGNSQSWHFGEDGNLTVPGDIRSEGNINIEINLADSTKRIWQFGEDGALTFPDGTSQTTAGGGGGTSDRLVAADNQLVLGTEGGLTYPGDALQQASGVVTCAGNASTIVYTASGQYQHAIRLLILVEGFEGASATWDTQSCEIIIAKSFRDDDIAATVYGIVHTSTDPLATFTAEWDPILLRVQVLCTTPSANSVDVKTFATEITTSD